VAKVHSALEDAFAALTVACGHASRARWSDAAVHAHAAVERLPKAEGKLAPMVHAVGALAVVLTDHATQTNRRTRRQKERTER
jgi:hypothetical protein